VTRFDTPWQRCNTLRPRPDNAATCHEIRWDNAASTPVKCRRKVHRQWQQKRST